MTSRCHPERSEGSCSSNSSSRACEAISPWGLLRSVVHPGDCFSRWRSIAMTNFASSRACEAISLWGLLRSVVHPGDCFSRWRSIAMTNPWRGRMRSIAMTKHCHPEWSEGSCSSNTSSRACEAISPWRLLRSVVHPGECFSRWRSIAMTNPCRGRMRSIAITKHCHPERSEGS